MVNTILDLLLFTFLTPFDIGERDKGKKYQNNLCELI